MPFRRHFGFVFMENSQQLKANSQKLYHTVAHELAHGAFGLEHPWQSKGTTQGDTYNLLDYTAKTPNNLLRKYQWYVIHNPKMSLFGGDEEEVSDESVFEIDFSEITEPKDNNCLTFLTPAGKPISISGVKSPNFTVEINNAEPLPKKALYSFTLIDNNINKNYVAIYYGLGEKGQKKAWSFVGYLEKSQYKGLTHDEFKIKYKNNEFNFYSEKEECKHLTEVLPYTVCTGIKDDKTYIKESCSIKKEEIPNYKGDGSLVPKIQINNLQKDYIPKTEEYDRISDKLEYFNYTTASGNLIKIPKNAPVSFKSEHKSIPKGTLISFMYLGQKYTALYEINSNNYPFKFMGYFNEGNEKYPAPNIPYEKDDVKVMVGFWDGESNRIFETVLKKGFYCKVSGK